MNYEVLKGTVAQGAKKPLEPGETISDRDLPQHVIKQLVNAKRIRAMPEPKTEESPEGSQDDAGKEAAASESKTEESPARETATTGKGRSKATQ